MTQTGIENPTDLSDYDWLEFGAFCLKADNEGFTYTAEEYGPAFDSPDMQAIADDLGKLRAYYVENEPKYKAWAETVGWERAIALHNAHIDEERQRKRDACLWGIRCEDGYVIHERTLESRSREVAYLLEKQGNGWRVPVALLYRDTPGGEWTEETPIPARSQP